MIMIKNCLLRIHISHWVKNLQLTKYSLHKPLNVESKESVQTPPPEKYCSRYYSTECTPFPNKLVVKIDFKRLKKCLDKFCVGYEFQKLCEEHSINEILLFEVLFSFRQYCLRTDELPYELYTILKDLTIRDCGSLNASILFPYFLNHYKEKFPHYFYDKKLKALSDLRNPANWYAQARSKKRKIIFHAGPTNSGKTYEALQRFLSAKSGIYCSPLKLLATEICNKSNGVSTPCDLLTGESRKFANADGTPSLHMACTIEMAPLDREFDVAIIDEIQFIRDWERGRAWVRAILGVCANEIHLCGEAVAIDLLKKICETTGETLEVHKYDRLTKFSIEDTALNSFGNVQPGDCIVCFRKSDIYYVSHELESRGIEVAVLYGALPPEVKLAHAAKFNDPIDNCKVMVATDVIGTGLNLCIRRIIFYSMTKQCANEYGEKQNDILSVSSTLQIAGRAGRYGTQFEHGFVTTFRQSDMPILKYLLAQQPEAVQRAGIAPNVCGYPFDVPKTIDQLEHCGIVFEICNCYLWLSYRFPENFTNADRIREFQSELSKVIQRGVHEIKRNSCFQKAEGRRRRGRTLSKRLQQQLGLTSSILEIIKSEIEAQRSDT